MTKAQILLVEDDREIRALIGEYLTDRGYGVLTAGDGRDGLSLFRQSAVDMVVLDLMLPVMSGDGFLTELRKVSQVPVLVLSARELTTTKVELLRMGADDYLTKPFDLDELEARVEAALRRSAAARSTGVLAHGEIRLDPERRCAQAGGRPLTLTGTEYRLLELFLRRPDKVFSKDELAAALWPGEESADDNAVTIHISRLRRKLRQAGPEREYIETLWGLGYRLV